MNTKLFGAGLLLAGTVVMQSPAHADVTGGSSKGYGIFVSLQLVGVPVLTIPETAVAQGTAPGPYNQNAMVLSVGASSPVVGSVSTGVLEATALCDINGGVGIRFAYAGALVDDLSITLVPSAVVPPLLALNADTIGADSFVSGDYGGFSALGGMVLENLTAAVSGTALNIPLNPAPNTVLFDSLGLRIVLNEQFSTTNVGNVSQITNALHIELDDVLTTGGLLSGEIIVAHSDAQMAGVVPEPGTFVGLGAGLGLLALLRRRPGRR